MQNPWGYYRFGIRKLATPFTMAKWLLSLGVHEWIAGGGLIVLPDGDLLAFLYGRICDSGVHVVQIKPAGELVWQTYCSTPRS